MRIRAYRLSHGLSQGQLARALPGPPVESATVSRWERGESWPNYAHICALAELFRIREEQLIGDAAEAPAPDVRKDAERRTA